MSLLHKDNLCLREELRGAFQNFTKNLIVEAGHKLLCDDPTIYGLIFTWNRFHNFV